MGVVRYLLDTCTFLWHAQSPSHLSTAAVAALNEPDGEHFLSDVSLLEICLKHSAGKLPLPSTPREWIPPKLDYHQQSERRACTGGGPSHVFQSMAQPGSKTMDLAAFDTSALKERLGSLRRYL